MYSVSTELYEEVAARLKEAIGPAGYFSGTITVPFEEVECRLTTSVFVYRERESFPEGESERISDLVAVWWEFHTDDAASELLNDFDFGELKSYL